MSEQAEDDAADRAFGALDGLFVAAAALGFLWLAARALGADATDLDADADSPVVSAATAGVLDARAARAAGLVSADVVLVELAPTPAVLLGNGSLVRAGEPIGPEVTLERIDGPRGHLVLDIDGQMVRVHLGPPSADETYSPGS